MNQQHVRKTVTRFEDTKPVEPKPKPIQPEQEQKDLIHQFKVKANPGIMRKNGINIPEIIEVISKLINTKTRNKAVFHPTTKIPLLPNPIEDISTHFPPSIAKLQDFFHVHEPNERNAEIHLSFTMPGTSEEALHVSMKNILKKYSLWLTSDELSAIQKM